MGSHILRLPKVSHFLVSDPILFSSLAFFDAELARETREAGCPHCGEALHQANYPRKPRGVPEDQRSNFSFRFSFCCSRCRRRVTSPSLRFLGRKVFAGLIVVLASCREGPISAWFSSVSKAYGISMRTLWRWRSFWVETVPRTTFWQEAKGRLMPVPDPATLPQALLGALSDWHEDPGIALLRFLKPLSIGPMIKALEGF